MKQPKLNRGPVHPVPDMVIYSCGLYLKVVGVDVLREAFHFYGVIWDYGLGVWKPMTKQKTLHEWPLSMCTEGECGWTMDTPQKFNIEDAL